MTPGRIIDIVVCVAVGLFLLWGGNALYATLTAPAKLEAALGNNAALAKGAEAQNAGVVALKKAGDERKKKSEVAVKAAGNQEIEDAAKILATPAAGATPVERAAARINAELGL